MISLDGGGAGFVGGFTGAFGGAKPSSIFLVGKGEPLDFPPPPAPLFPLLIANLQFRSGLERRTGLAETRP